MWNSPQGSGGPGRSPGKNADRLGSVAGAMLLFCFAGKSGPQGTYLFV